MDDVKRPFGASVRAWRRRLGISQEELAARAGLHRTYVCDVERGTRNVSLESIEKLAHALQVSTATLFSYSEVPGNDAEPGPPVRGVVDILYVEDMLEDVEMAMQTLKNAGIANRIRVARDGAEALQLLLGEETSSHAAPPQRYRPHVILLDLSLPKVNGLEVLRRIKSDPSASSIPVVVLTASARESDWHASKRLGASAYIVKPLNFESLTRVTPKLGMQWALVNSTAAA